MNNLEFAKNVCLPLPAFGHGLPEARCQWGIGLLRSILKFEAPKPLMLLLISPGHGNMVSKSRGCAPNPAFSSPPRGLYIYKPPSSGGAKSANPPPLSWVRPLGGQNQVGISDFWKP